MGKIKTIVNKTISILLLISVTAVITYFASVGTLQGDGSVAFTTAGLICDKDCPELTGGKVEPLGAITIKRDVLHCRYMSLIHGELVQDYWAGPWTYEDGIPLPKDFNPAPPIIYNDDARLKEAKRDEDGKPVCPKMFDLKYGQRGLYNGEEK